MTPSTLEAIVLEPGFFERVGEVICRIAASHSEPETVHLLGEAKKHLGADAAVFCSFLRDETDQLRFMLACEPGWIHEYERVVCASHDPWIMHASNSSEAVCGSHLNIQSHAQLEALSFARRFGFESTLIVPAPSSGGAARFGLLVLGSRREGFFESEGHTAVKVMARPLAMELHGWWVAQSRRELIMRAKLTGIDLELLCYLHRGLSSKQIAHELRRSTNAVDLLVSRLTAKLGVSRRGAAATLAAAYGLI